MSDPNTATTAADRGIVDRGTMDRGTEEPRTPMSTAGADEAPVPNGQVPQTLKADTVQEFMRLLEDGPKDLGSAPPILTLPRPLLRDMFEQLDISQSTNEEQGLLFGYMAPKITYGSIFVTGKEDQIDYSKARKTWRSIKVIGTFHTHPLSIGIDAGGASTGVTGGGHSGNDITNFFRKSERASVVASYRRDGRRVIYFLLKPQNFTIPGTPQRVGQAYADRVITKMDKGADAHDASRQELTDLAHAGAFVFYFGVDSQTLLKQ